MSDYRQLIAVLTDRRLSDGQRAHAAELIGERQFRDAITALLAVARRETEPAEVLTAVGTALARLYLADDRILEAPLHDFAEPAYLAFDHTVATAQRSQ